MRIFYTSVSDMDDELYSMALSIIRRERREKAERIKIRQEKKRVIAAGLLLNYASGICKNSESGVHIEEIKIKELIGKYNQNYDYEIITLKNGKPIFKDKDIYFNLSHSGEYAVCVISSKPVGIDIEGNKIIKDSIIDRFFLEKEKQWILENEKEKRARFFKVWTFKEAYGKATGEGVAAIIKKVDYIEYRNASIIDIFETQLSDYCLCCVELNNFK